MKIRKNSNSIYSLICINRIILILNFSKSQFFLKSIKILFIIIKNNFFHWSVCNKSFRLNFIICKIKRNSVKFIIIFLSFKFKQRKFKITRHFYYIIFNYSNFKHITKHFSHTKWSIFKH